MKKITKFSLFLMAFFACALFANAQTSLYCATPSGHLGDPNFGAVASHILLTITNVDANNISVKVEPNTGGSPIDFLQVNPSGAASVIVGTDEGALLPEYKATINYTTPPASVTLEILWSNPGWAGRWMVQNIVVPFSAICSGGGTADTEAPASFTATKGAVTSNSVELLLNATDNSGSVTYAVTYGSTTLTTTGTSGTQKSYVVTGLTPSTAYSFSVTAKDAANNAATNNPIVVNATTAAAASLSTIDFETVGTNWAWTLFENGDNAPTLYSVVSNPASNSVNSSAHCAKYVVNPNGQPWAGLWSNDLPDFTFTADNCIVKVMVYKDAISNFDVKFENDNASVAFEKQVANTKTNEWEELTFDFSNKIGTSVSRLVIIPDFPGTRTAGSTNYFDNISFNSNSGPIIPTAPTVAATTPSIAANKVISLFSNAYTDVPVDTWRTSWSNASYEAVQIAGNDTKKYSDLVFVGIETTGANFVNASAMTHLHLDIWTPDMTTFKVKLVDFGADAAWSGGDDVEHELTLSPTLSAWNSYNIPLSDFTGLTTRSHLAQYIFSGSPTGKVFIDNIYFYNSTSTAVNPAHEGTTRIFPNPVKNILNIVSTNEISKLTISNLVGQTVKNIQVNGTEKSVEVNDLANGQYIITLENTKGEKSNLKFVKN